MIYRNNIRWLGWAALALIAVLAGPALAGCAAQPPAPPPTLAALPTYTPYPTYTPPPTYTPLPTYTPQPTLLPPTDTPAPTPTPTATPVIYTVQRGDWATVIAKKFGVTLQALLTANNITNPNLIEPGQQLFILRQVVRREGNA